MFNFRKSLLKIEKLLGIKRCCQCDKYIWWQKGRLRYTENPENDCGFSAPTCKNCIYLADKHKYDR